jgi:hypothetical protein
MAESPGLIKIRVNILTKDPKAQQDENLDLKVEVALLKRTVGDLQRALGDKQPLPLQSARGMRLEDDEELEHPQRRTRTDDASGSRLPHG